MIVSVSRRTDIPAFYGDWFRNRLRAGSCRVANPFDPGRVRTVSLARADVDAFVFWTRNPAPFAPVLAELDGLGFPYLVLLTLTGYGPPLEPHAPAAGAVLAAARALAGRIGPERLVWRYDPIVLGPGLAPADHERRFAELAAAFEGVATSVRVSFLDLYRKTRRRLAALPGGEAYLADPATPPAIGELVAALVAVAARHGMRVATCAEGRDWSAFGACPGACVDGRRLPRVLCVDAAAPDPGQRPACRCAPSVDIGVNDTCLHGCAYCYATSSHERARRRAAGHDPAADSLLPL